MSNQKFIVIVIIFLIHLFITLLAYREIKVNGLTLERIDQTYIEECDDITIKCE